MLDRLAGCHKKAILNADALDEATHCFRTRRDMESEARHNQGGVAAYGADVQQGKEMFPVHSMFSDKARNRILKKTSSNLPNLVLPQPEITEISRNLPLQSEKQSNGPNTFLRNASADNFH